VSAAASSSSISAPIDRSPPNENPSEVFKAKLASNGVTNMPMTLDAEALQSAGRDWANSHSPFQRDRTGTGHGSKRFWSAIGNGGQRLIMFPGLDMVVAITAGNYDTPDQWVPPTRVIREVVLPSIL